MNKERLLQLADYIQQLPSDKAINMGVWLTTKQRVFPELKGEKTEIPCGTVGCIAGWGMVCFRAKHDSTGIGSTKFILPGQQPMYGTESSMTAFLDLSPVEARRLFYRKNWPRNKHLSSASRQGVANRIRYFVREGK